MNPKITIITPMYNAEQWIDEVARSICRQEGVHFSYIIIDDGSTDGSLAIARQLGREFPETIQVLTQRNSGEARTVNRGIQESKSEYICIVSADDPLLPGHLVRMTDVLDHHPECVVAYPDWLMIDGEGRPIREVQTLEYDQRALIADFVCVPGPGSVIRRSAIHDSYLRNPKFRYVSDYDAWLRLSETGCFIRVPAVLASYRIHENQATASGRGEAMATEIELVVSEFFSSLNEQSGLRRYSKRARAFASYYAGIQKLYNPRVPGRRRVIKSLLLQYPRRVDWNTHRRHPLAILAVLLSPVGHLIQSRRSSRTDYK